MTVLCSQNLKFVQSVPFQVPGGLEHLKNQFVKHIARKSDVISVVRKEVDSEGVIRLKEETFNYDQVMMNAPRLKGLKYFDGCIC